MHNNVKILYHSIAYGRNFSVQQFSIQQIECRGYMIQAMYTFVDRGQNKIYVEVFVFQLYKNVECYAPEYMGRQDILVAFDKIARIQPDISPESLPDLTVTECNGKIACPGFLDQHVHITGGGGEQGPQSSIEPIRADALAAAGITTVVGLLGADGVGKSMESLLMKARALEAEGLTAYIYAGNYGLPPVTITGRVLTDIALIDKIIGAGEIAISDYRSSCPSGQELMKLAYEALTGGMLGKKAGVVHLHVGDGKAGLKPLTDLLRDTDFPVSMFVPTHLNRNRGLFKQALQYWQNGGNIDLTAGENTDPGCGVPQCLKELLGIGKNLDRVTVSSDGNGSGAGPSHTGTANVTALFDDIRTAVAEFKLPPAEVLKTVTSNVAKVLKLQPAKGRLAVGSDADMLLLDGNTFTVGMLFSRGRLLYSKA